MSDDATRQPLEGELLIPSGHPASARTAPRPQPSVEERLQSYRRRAVWLFLATIVTTFLAGTLTHLQLDLQHVGRSLVDAAVCGAAYSATIMSILVAHEMGHYLQARRYGVPATPPMFIPMPLPPLGTMGAVIVQGAGYTDRRTMFDIAVSGPLAGLVVAIPALAWGGRGLPIVDTSPGGLVFNDSLLTKWILALVNSPLPPGQDYMFGGTIQGAVFFAGWFGILITGVNLVPLGQLDGGHILYSLIGRHQHTVARYLFMAAVMYFVYALFTTAEFGWGVMLILVAIMGIRHPPTRDDRIPLDPVRQAIGWFTLALLFICFVPSPVSEYPETPAPSPASRQAEPAERP